MPKVKVTAETIFERHEKKYLLIQPQYDRLTEYLAERMWQDQYGLHTICSLYFDTDDYLLIRKSLDKPAYKEKLRLRGYGVPGREDTVFLELKKKLAGVTYKRRVPMTLAEAQDYLRGGAPPEHAGQILDEIEWFMQRYRPGPKVVLCYDRTVLYGVRDKALRITFDTNIRWRTDNLDLAKGDYGTRLLSSGERLMEIKMAGAFSCWLSRFLSKEKIFSVSFSKYGMVYKNILLKEGKKLVG